MKYGLMVLVVLARAGIPIQVAMNSKLREAVQSPPAAVALAFLIGSLAMAVLAASKLMGAAHFDQLGSAPLWAWGQAVQRGSGHHLGGGSAAGRSRGRSRGNGLRAVERGDGARSFRLARRGQEPHQRLEDWRRHLALRGRPAHAAQVSIWVRR